MDISVIVNIILCVLSFILAVVSLVTVVLTLRQNNKMIEESTRPVIAVYTQSVNLSKPALYLVVKNFGNSPAYMKTFVADFDFTGYFLVNTNKNYINEFSKCTFAPGQSRICLLDSKKIKSKVHFSVEYSSHTKAYKDCFDIDLSAASGLPYMKYEQTDKELHGISIALQELLLKNL